MHTEVESRSTVLYSNFKCEYPLKVGTSCPLELKIGGIGGTNKHMGKIYIADAMGKPTAIPVYINYKLVSEPLSMTLDEGQRGEFKLKLKNFGSDRYSSIQLSNLPNGASITSNSCSGGIANGETCELVYDLSSVVAGDYIVNVTGVKPGANSSAPDMGQLKIHVNSAW